jgi:predicted Rossmann fold nucleotide-binding protein DprA/Smf involved in DNA uptake
VVASDVKKGGTWAGATEALREKWIPVFVLEHPNMPEGNKLLLKKGALVFPHPLRESHLQLTLWLETQSAKNKPDTCQPGLF